jgi:hypothetical protein
LIQKLFSPGLGQEKRYWSFDKIKPFSRKEMPPIRYSTFKKAGSSSVFLSEQGKEAVVAILEPGQFFG